MVSRGTILVVDDDSDLADLYQQVLEGEGYRVLLAASVAAGREILAAFRVSLVITDAFYPGPGADPWLPLAPLVASAGDTPLVLSTAHRSRFHPDPEGHGFAATLPKPFDLDHLIDLVATLLGPGPRPESRPAPHQPLLL